MSAPTAPATPALRIGPLELASPVVLAPMAGVTNVAFRTLCRELEQEQQGSVSGLYVCEMVTARALVERQPATLHMATFAPEESPRSLQLYTVDSEYTYQAAKMIVDEDLADHIDINFGCPVPRSHVVVAGRPSVQASLFRSIVSAAVRATEGTESGHGQDAGGDRRRAPHPSRRRPDRRRGGAQAVALHARTAAQRYSGQADWSQISAWWSTSAPYRMSRFWVTATSPPRTRCGCVTRRAAPAWSVAAAWAVRGCSPSSLRDCRGGRPPLLRRSVRSRASCTATVNSSRSTTARTRACETSVSTSPGTCAASRRVRRSVSGCPRCARSTISRRCWRICRRTSRSRRTATARVDVRARRRRCCCPAGSTTRRTTRWPWRAPTPELGRLIARRSPPGPPGHRPARSAARSSLAPILRLTCGYAGLHASCLLGELADLATSMARMCSMATDDMELATHALLQVIWSPPRGPRVVLGDVASGDGERRTRVRPLALRHRWRVICARSSRRSSSSGPGQDGHAGRPRGQIVRRRHPEPVLPEAVDTSPRWAGSRSRWAGRPPRCC